MARHRCKAELDNFHPLKAIPVSSPLEASQHRRDARNCKLIVLDPNQSMTTSQQIIAAALASLKVQRPGYHHGF